ncbi:O-acetyl-ADP-ribose deacetylase [Rhodococcus sp. NPDC049939]|uniref:O-acetyl-ADP-ribose deacetylase n=1 Tax=Rhodococcus sp. NPDC049939 TaxID=3155511 RepID=UPI0033F008C9
MRLSEEQTDRASGVLLATASGDALGAGYEFTTPRPDAVIDMIGGGVCASAPGEWSDDTSMAIGIAKVAARGTDISGGPGLDAVAAQFVRWYDSGTADTRSQTSAVLSSRPASADEMRKIARALPGRKGGNSSLMRTGPVALAYLGDADGCLRAARAVSLLTHDDKRAVEACEMWTYAVRHAVLHGTFDGIRKYLARASTGVRDYWESLLDLAERGTPEQFPNNGWVVDALLTAWWAITTTDSTGPEHLQRALEQAVRAGHDTSTTAAIAGGLLGARWGASAVPVRWRKVLHGWPGYRSSDLVRLGVRTTKGGDNREGGRSSTQLNRPARSGVTSERAAVQDRRNTQGVRTRTPVINIVHGDITKQRVDAIVNATDSLLSGNGGVDRAIHRWGGPALPAACRRLRATTLPDGLAVGAAIATTAGKLPAKWVIHTVGPEYSRQEDRSDVLRACYRRSLAVADGLDATTVAFPLISSGTFGWPRADAVLQAVEAVRRTRTNVEVVTFVAFDQIFADLLRRTV